MNAVRIRDVGVKHLSHQLRNTTSWRHLCEVQCAIRTPIAASGRLDSEHGNGGHGHCIHAGILTNNAGAAHRRVTNRKSCAKYRW
jgi:hypothetical protein